MTSLSERPTWLLIGSRGLWAADCLVPGCLWTVTASTPEAADDAATTHAETEHIDQAHVEPEDLEVKHP